MEIAASGASEVSCEQRSGLARRLCQALRRVLALAGRGGSWGVPF
ncbi:hypothetical protein [Nocardioides daeguensis]|uniref:Uncharacterized protein n=1 Tax=Nocardioides daeguensis TaxID=908359 RepID=A0ABP6VKJ7_9ACTN|nr:hypothetical protein [Nocardioides daeguensis]